MDDLLVFNLLRYILLFLIVYCGSISIKTHAYWKFNIYPLILFAVMEGCRWKRGVDYIYSESFTGSGLGTAIMNRLIKAAGHRVIQAPTV